MFFDDSFNKLLTFLQMDLQVNVAMVGLSNGGAILPEIRVYICHQYSAGGGASSDIKFFTAWFPLST